MTAYADTSDLFCQLLAGEVIFLNPCDKNCLRQVYFHMGEKRRQDLGGNSFLLKVRKQIDTQNGEGGVNPLQLTESAEGETVFFPR